MKVFFTIIAICITFQEAWANDTSMPYIQINNLTFKGSGVGTKITFQGEQALTLFNVLPVKNAMGYARGFAAKGEKKAILIGCETSIFDEKKTRLY